MNVVYSTLVLLGEFVRLSQTFKGERLKAVTQFQDLQQYYEMIKTQGRRRNLEIDVSTKERICGSIFTNPFFNMRDESAFPRENRRNRKWLKRKNPAIFEEFFGAGSEGTSSGPAPTYVNPDLDRAVAVEGDLSDETEYYEERVFVCLTKRRYSETVDKYFVSVADYNMNRAINANGINQYVAGRFVFTEAGVGVNELLVHALAEESGQTFRKGETAVEKFYLGRKEAARREQREIVGTFQDDPVCTLSRDEKLRLCAIVMSSPHLEQLNYEFQPQNVFLEDECKLREVSFKTARGMLSLGEHKEWTISCQVKNEDHVYEPFYVSRGYAANAVYVYKPVHGFMFLHSFQDNVSVLRG